MHRWETSGVRMIPVALWIVGTVACGVTVALEYSYLLGSDPNRAGRSVVSYLAALAVLSGTCVWGTPRKWARALLTIGSLVVGANEVISAIFFLDSPALIGAAVCFMLGAVAALVPRAPEAPGASL